MSYQAQNTCLDNTILCHENSFFMFQVSFDLYQALPGPGMIT